MNRWRTLAAAWFQTFITFELVLHAKDLIKPGLLIQAALAAFLPIAIRWIDPKDKFPDGE